MNHHRNMLEVIRFRVLGFRVQGLGFRGLGCMEINTPVTGNQMAKNMENEMEAWA